MKPDKTRGIPISICSLIPDARCWSSMEVEGFAFIVLTGGELGNYSAEMVCNEWGCVNAFECFAEFQYLC